MCLLGSLNLVQYIGLDRQFDYEQYINDIKVFARMLDNVNDITTTSLPQYNWAIKNVRQYGMGINGLGSALFMLGLKYGSEQANEFINKINWLKEEYTWETSALLAKEKGAFPAYNEQFLETDWFTKFTTISSDTKELIKKYGVRNGKTTTNPPLGNSSVLCDNISNGIEPVFSYGYERTYIADAWPDGLDKAYIESKFTPTFFGDKETWTGYYDDKKYYYEPHNRGLCRVESIYDYGYRWIQENYPKEVNAEYMVTSDDLDVNDHVNVQSIVQRNINQSVSKTVNLPNNYSFDSFKQLYMYAWESGLNGLTTYRSGTMESVISKSEEEPEEVDVLTDVKLPDNFINGPCEVIKREGKKFYIHFSYLPEDKKMKRPIAMWIQSNNGYTGEAVYVNKALRSLETLLLQFGINAEQIHKTFVKLKDDQPNARLAKATSMCLRHRIPLASIVTSLENLEGDNVSTLLTAVRKFLSSHIKNGTKIKGKVCTKCGESNLIFQSGCSNCPDCGNSNCG